jgi:hypothetical protein
MDNIRLKRRHKKDRKEYQENQKEMLPWRLERERASTL